MVWESSEVEAGDEVLAEQYNNLRTDAQTVLDSAVPLGSIIMWAGGTGDVPSGWDLCDGSAISRTTYSDLYTLLGNTFGAGDGSTTFNLPDMRDRFVIGAGSSYSRNSKGGSETHTLTTAEMPVHTHAQNSHSHTCGGNNVSHTHGHSLGNFVYAYPPSGGDSLQEYSSGSRIRLGHGGSTAVQSADHIHAIGGTTATNQNTGSGNAHENRPPYIGMFYIIKIE